MKPRSRDVVVAEWVVGRGRAAFAAAKRAGLEGIVGKRVDRPYVEKRTRDWVKIKAQHEQEFVVAGWTEPTGSREGLGSLVLGVYDHGRAGLLRQCRHRLRREDAPRARAEARVDRDEGLPVRGEAEDADARALGPARPRR